MLPCGTSKILNARGVQGLRLNGDDEADNQGE